MKLMFTSANFRVIPPLSPLRPTRAGLGMSVTRLLAASLLLQGVAIGQGQKVAVTVSPASVSLTTSQSQQFTAAVTGNSTSGVTWSVSPALGTISRTGLYTAPASVWSVQIVTVTATTVGSPSKSGSASVSLAPPVSLSISPATSTLSVSQNQQFTAAVTGTTNTGVIWSVSPAVGTVSSAGLYTAPASVSRLQSVIVSATSTANPAQAASATVMLQPPLTISTGALADGNAGSGYIQTLAASGGAPPYSWTISSGSLPPGLSLVDSTISGTPTIAGSYPMSIQVKDNSGLQVSKSLNLVVAAALLITT